MDTTQKEVPCQEQATLPLIFGATSVKRICTLYGKILHDKLGVSPTINYGMIGGATKRLLKTDNEIQISALLLAYFNYKPKDYKDWLAKTIVSSAYPFELFVKNINTMKMYLVKDKGIDLGDIDNLKTIVYNYIDGLQNN